MVGQMMCLLQAERTAGGQGAGQERVVNVVLLVLALKILNRKDLELGNY